MARIRISVLHAVPKRRGRLVFARRRRATMIDLRPSHARRA